MVEKLVLVAMATVAAATSALAVTSLVLVHMLLTGLFALKVVANAHLPLFDLLQLLLELDLKDLSELASLAALNFLVLVELHFVVNAKVLLGQRTLDELVASEKLQLDLLLALDLKDASARVPLSDDDVALLADLDALLDAVDVIDESLLLGVDLDLAHTASFVRVQLVCGKAGATELITHSLGLHRVELVAEALALEAKRLGRGCHAERESLAGDRSRAQ